MQNTTFKEKAIFKTAKIGYKQSNNQSISSNKKESSTAFSPKPIYGISFFIAKTILKI